MNIVRTWTEHSEHEHFVCVRVHQLLEPNLLCRFRFGPDTPEHEPNRTPASLNTHVTRTEVHVNFNFTRPFPSGKEGWHVYNSRPTLLKDQVGIANPWASPPVCRNFCCLSIQLIDQCLSWIVIGLFPAYEVIRNSLFKMKETDVTVRIRIPLFNNLCISFHIQCELYLELEIHVPHRRIEMA